MRVGVLKEGQGLDPELKMTMEKVLWEDTMRKREARLQNEELSDDSMGQFLNMPALVERQLVDPSSSSSEDDLPLLRGRYQTSDSSTNSSMPGLFQRDSSSDESDFEYPPLLNRGSVPARPSC